jgi:hypothetical protein
MKQRWLHTALAILVLAQPVAGAGAWAAMMSARLDGAAMTADMGGKPTAGCHDAMPETPDCCDQMDGVHCGMDCGTVSPAVSQHLALLPDPGHAAWNSAVPYAAPDHPPGFFFKPPRTS